MIFSAKSHNSLQRLVKECIRYADRHPNRVVDLSYTLNLRNNRLPHRAFAVLRNGLTTVSPLQEPINVPRIAMIFTGSGEGWPEMARGLIEKDAFLKADIKAMDEVLRTLRYRPEWNIEVE